MKFLKVKFSIKSLESRKKAKEVSVFSNLTHEGIKIYRLFKTKNRFSSISEKKSVLDKISNFLITCLEKL